MIIQPLKMKLDNFKRGWFVGNFNPTILKANNEVGIQSYHAGECHKEHYHEYTTEVNICVSGKCKFILRHIDDEEQINFELVEDEILIIPPNYITKFLALTNCKVVVVKDRSDGKVDKILAY